MKRSRRADSTGSRFGALSRHWDLLAAVGIMLSAGALALLVRGLLQAPTEPAVVRAPATAAPATDEPYKLAGRNTPAAEERDAASPATPIALAAAKPTPLGIDPLVNRWLAGHCRRVEARYEEQGRERWRCSWQDVRISGSLPAVEVAFTRVDRAVGAGGGAAMELLAREHFRLTCVDDACSRLTSLPGTRRKIGAKPARTATPTRVSPLDAASAKQENHPPVVEILAAPQRVAPGERVVLESRVTDPDSASGDEAECAWSVDGKPVARLCWQLVWTVPATKTHGNVVFTLKARDRYGASGSKSVSIAVGTVD